MCIIVLIDDGYIAANILVPVALGLYAWTYVEDVEL